MRQIFWGTVAIALLTGALANGQSLGDIARANREKQQTEDQSATPPKMITNADLPKNLHPASDDTPRPANAASGSATQHRPAQQTLAEQRASEQWRQKILTQKRKTENLQARLDQMNASIRSQNGSAQFDGPSGRGQALQMQRAAELQAQLDEQRRSLFDMQEAARRAGMHTTVYDP